MSRYARTIYADYHATTPVRPEVLEAMLPWLSGLSGNASSIHAAGRAARRAVEEARERVGRAIGARPEEIIFTSGGTESNNLAVIGAARAARKRDPRRNAVLVSAVEHPSVREAARSLVAEGFTVKELTVDPAGCVLPGELASVLDSGVLPALASFILVNNETGAIQTGFSALGERLLKKGVPVHADGVQAIGKMKVDAGELEANLLSLAAHKFGGPKGVGVLYVKKGIPLEPVLHGGGQEKKRRPGTENVPGIVGLGVAIEITVARLVEDRERIRALRDRFERGLASALPEVRINCSDAARVATVSSVVFPGIDAETLLIALDLEGIEVSAGSACSSGTVAPSHVLTAMGLSPEAVRSTLRFSFGWGSADADIERLLEVVPVVVRRMSASAPS